MNIRIAGVWDMFWNTPIKEMDLWEYMIRDFAVDAFFMTPISGIRNKYVQERETLQDILDENQDCQIIFLDEGGDVSLTDFVHPKNALYVFGKANFSTLGYKKENDISLKIETVLTGGLLWPHQAAAIVLYDRLRK